MLQRIDGGSVLFLYCFLLSYLTDTVYGIYGNQPLAMITTGNRMSANRDATNADYSRKVTVRVSDVLTRQRAAMAAAAASASSYSSGGQPRLESPMSRSMSNYPGNSRHAQQPSNSNTPSFTRPILLNPVNTHAKEAEKSSVSSRVTASPRARIVVGPSKVAPPSSALVVPMANSQPLINEDQSWPPEHAQEFARVDVRVLGERIDSKALLHLRPNVHPSSVRKLRKILGLDLQPEWMSVDPPPKTREDSSKAPRSVMRMDMPKPSEHILKAVNNLNFTVFRPAKGTDVVIPIEFNHEQITLMKEWLLQLATCRMEFIWEDLGALFWPRWIRRGICVNTMSCSWPPGMRCLPSGSRMLKLLRWVCTNDDQKIREARTRWRRGPGESSLAYRRYRRDQNTDRGTRRRFTREERRSRRVRRLIRKLSLTAHGYHCEWSRYEYMVSDHCVCGTG